ncbi:hypothetical protein HUW46_07229 [Amycolatopsis sp. CA-230715]|nr:hypothetical protein HUW46_07229 [Amycolatopsis sp. CA-230715]
MIADDYAEVVLLTGPKYADAAVAKEFAIALASSALAFAGVCNRRLMSWPSADAITEVDHGIG